MKLIMMMTCPIRMIESSCTRTCSQPHDHSTTNEDADAKMHTKTSLPSPRPFPSAQVPLKCNFKPIYAAPSTVRTASLPTTHVSLARPNTLPCRWVEFKRGLFRSTSRPLEQASSSNGDAHVSRAAAQAAEILDKRPVREVKKPEAFSPRRTADIKKRPPPLPEPPAAASKAARAPRPSSSKAAGGRRTTEAAAAAAARRRKEAKGAAALTSSSSAGVARGSKREASGEAAGGVDRAAKKARTSSSSSKKSKARKTDKGGGKGGHTSNSSKSNGSQAEGGDEGLSGSGKPNGGAHRRDWGLMHMGDVGRNKPPFARTLLFKGSLSSGVRFSGEPSPQNTRWVVKRWPEKSTRRKVDLEVHELIRQNPCHNIVEIVGVDANDGVLMEYCPDGDLQALLAKSRRKYMPLRLVAVRLLGLMQGLAHLHKLNIVHSDVSPANVFLRPAELSELSNGSDSDDEEEGSSSQDGDAYLECVLGDFGHSYVLEQHTESRSSVANHCGSEFVAPEVENGSVSTMASDVYSAGMILSQLVTMCSQFKENFSKESTSLVRALSNLAKSMSQERPHMRPTAMACVKSLRKTMMGWGN